MSTDEAIRKARLEEQAIDRKQIVDWFSVEELRHAFHMVADHEDWKRPIRGWVHPSLLQVVLRSIEFHTATKGSVGEVDSNGRILVVADGYRAGSAGDR
jgi:hypothetical protein